MDTGELIYLACRLLPAAAAAILAILLWSRTRDGAWMLTALAVVFLYVDAVYSMLELFGITRGVFVSVGGVDVFRVVFSCLPALFFIAAFALMIRRRRR